MGVSINGEWLVDEQGRVLQLRGVNLSGSSKMPTRPDGATHNREGFLDHRNVSFVGRPFPLAEADEHLRRLKAWGLTTLRFLVTWEAIEHTGPGEYDQEYLDYLYAVIKKASDAGFTILIDPHQDVWSRFSGGDGAPGWTLEAVGFELDHVHETGAAIVHQFHGDPFPQMVWPTNGGRLAAATMFTLFFGGNDFAPATLIEGVSAQEYLQQHYIRAFQQVAQRIAGLAGVIGYESMNEPMRGFIGVQDLNHPLLQIKFGAWVSPLQGMLLGSGIPQEIEIWERTLLRSRLVERRLMNPGRLKIWREGYDGVWRQNGVWDLDERGRVRVLRPQHFAQVSGHKVDFSSDYLRPFVNRFAAGIRQVHPEALIFLESDPRLPPPLWGPDDAPNIVYAPHWYDPTVLFLKTYTPWVGYNVHTEKLVVGPQNVRKSCIDQMATHRRYARQYLRGAPTLIGETGIAFDLNRRTAYRTGDFTAQIRALDRTLHAMEANCLSYTLWNYTPNNDNTRGDQWNGEDLSIFSRDQQHDLADIHSGGRALEALLRPYPRATAGQPLRMSFDLRRREFAFEFRHDASVSAPTEFFVPNWQYPNGYEVWVSDGHYQTDPQSQTLTYFHDEKRQIHRLRIRPC